MSENGFIIHNPQFCNSLQGIPQPSVLVLYANIIPPHVAFLYKDTYFSQTVAGGFEHSTSDTIGTLITRKKIPTLIIPINKLLNQVDETEVFKTFHSAGQLTSGGSCLNPVKKALQLFHTEIPIQGTLPVWLESLKQKNFIDAIFCQNLIINFPLQIPHYGNEEINRRIEELGANKF